MYTATEYSDAAFLKELGESLAQRRIALGLTQEVCATRAGVSKRTLENLESGRSITLENFIRLLRALGMLQDLAALLPNQQQSPMMVLRERGHVRKRASKKQVPTQRSATWKWGDER